MIGKHINRTIKSTLPASICLSGYLGGCILPDLSPRHLNVSHCNAESLHLIHSLIGNTLNSAPRSLNEMQHYSMELGIITHYICDCFCQAHTNPTYKDPLKHARYENKLAQKFKQTDLMHLAVPVIVPFKHTYPGFALMEYLDDKYASYLNHQSGIFLDICYSVQTSTTVVLSIVNHLLSTSKEQHDPPNFGIK